MIFLKMIIQVYNKIKSFFEKPKVEPVSERAIIKINPIAKENAIFDDENKIIELYRGDKVQRIKYSKSDVDALREQGIPVIDEEYTDDYQFLEGINFGGVESRR